MTIGKLGNADGKGACELVIDATRGGDRESVRFHVVGIPIVCWRGGALISRELIEEFLPVRVHPLFGKLVSADEELPVCRPRAVAAPRPTRTGHIDQRVSTDIPVKAQQIAASNVH